MNPIIWTIFDQLTYPYSIFYYSINFLTASYSSRGQMNYFDSDNSDKI